MPEPQPGKFPILSIFIMSRMERNFAIESSTRRTVQKPGDKTKDTPAYPSFLSVK